MNFSIFQPITFTKQRNFCQYGDIMHMNQIAQAVWVYLVNYSQKIEILLQKIDFINLKRTNKMDQQIFMGKQQKTFANYHIVYSDDIHSQQYLDQFLNIHDDTFEKDVHEEIHSHSIQEMKDQDDQKSNLQDKYSCQKSVFHNFQKHLVTTLRKNIIISQKSFTSQTKGIERKLWKCFVQCTKPTRTLIFLITVESTEQTLLDDIRIQKVYGMQRIFQYYPLELIHQAQQNLRKQILRQLESSNIPALLRSRRMRNKQQFKIYIQTFAQELKMGKINRRVPKQIKNSQINMQQQS